MVEAAPKVAILPNDMKLGLTPGAIPLDRLMWPLGVPEGIGGRTLRDLAPQDHLIVFPRKTLHWRPGFGTAARVSIAVLEPKAIHGGHLASLRRSHRRFYRVLTHDAALLADIPNGYFFPFGGTWVSEWQDVDTTKARMTSLIASSKRSQDGHVLRHAIVDWAGGAGVDLDVMGRGYKPFAAKAEGLAPYRYSVVIENVRERNYFTEKLVDAILCQTVPIYWGCPNIADFFDTSGMIICEDEADLRAAIQAASDEDYSARLPALRAMRPAAADYGDLYGRAARAVLE
ncbi:glycosyltransferase family 10 domain-containing protein [Roseovarius dicentrarchi]|uniref:glycosyltransferase family 10 domain-containing protein n=1 Tax=Roseovarius dicentrarchi TaxID=2250573 RepID=UPI000DEA1E6D|nr:glycosyltransferase family 10 [Roseovarius dicentrarchi]